MRRASQRRAAQAKESGKALQKDGIVSVTLVEGIKMIAMDDNGTFCRSMMDRNYISPHFTTGYHL